jgi:hypothetical protein
MVSRTDYSKMARILVQIEGSRAAAGKALMDENGKYPRPRTTGNWVSSHNEPKNDVDAVRMLIIIINKGKFDNAAWARKTLEKLLVAKFSPVREAFLLVDPSLKGPPSIEEPPYFDRFKEAVAGGDLLSNRGEQPGKSPKKERDVCPNRTLEERKSDFIRKKYGLGGKDKYYKGEKIFYSGREDLMQAVNEKQISVNCAEQLLDETPELVSELLSKGRKAVLTFLQEKT